MVVLNFELISYYLTASPSSYPSIDLEVIPPGSHISLLSRYLPYQHHHLPPVLLWKKGLFSSSHLPLVAKLPGDSVISQAALRGCHSVHRPIHPSPTTAQSPYRVKIDESASSLECKQLCELPGEKWEIESTFVRQGRLIAWGAAVNVRFAGRHLNAGVAGLAYGGTTVSDCAVMYLGYGLGRVTDCRVTLSSVASLNWQNVRKNHFKESGGQEVKWTEKELFFSYFARVLRLEQQQLKSGCL